MEKTKYLKITLVVEVPENFGEKEERKMDEAIEEAIFNEGAELTYVSEYKIAETEEG